MAIPFGPEPPAHRVIRRRDGAFVRIDRDARDVTHIRPLRAVAPNPDPYHRIMRIARWISEVTSVGLVEDPILIAALEVFEDALVAYLGARP